MKNLLYNSSKKNSLRGLVAWAPFCVFWLFRKDFRDAFDRLTWNRNQMKAYELMRLQAIVRLAYDKSPFYKKIYDDAGVHPQDIKNLKDIEKLPVLTKQMLREAIADKTIFTAPKAPRGIYETSTTGSSGNPLTLYYDASVRRNRYINGMRALFCMGALPDKRFALIWRKKEQSYGQRIRVALGLFKQVAVVDVVDAGSSALDSKSLDTIVRDLVAFNPQVIRGYTSALWVIAQVIQREKLPLCPEHVITSAEYLPQSWWDELENVYGCQVHNFYGGTEAAPIAASFAGERELTVFQDFYFTEIVNISAVSCVSGEAGRVIVTDFHSLYMPLIRYEVGDIAEWSDNVLSPLPKFKEVRGRINDIFVLPGGRILFSHNWHIYFRDIVSISKFKVLQKAVNVIEINLETNTAGQWNDELLGLKEKVVDSLGQGITLTWTLSDRIPLDAGEKFRAVKSEVDVSSILKNL